MDGPHGAVPLVSLNGTGTLAMRAAVRVGQRVLVVVSETESDSCSTGTEYAVMLDESDIRGARLGLSPRRPLRAIDLDEINNDPLPPLRAAKAFRAMPVEAVLKAARTAAATGMGYLAACWIRHNASVMPAHDLPALSRALAEDPLLAPLVPERLRRHAARVTSGASAAARPSGSR
jgi:hypothetical protein